MRIATFNVNSIKAHLPAVTGWLTERAPDVAGLQEIKCVDDAFPRLEIEALGYRCETFGQKTYNGVALLSKHKMEDVTRGLPGFADEQSRFIAARIYPKDGAPFHIANLYVPNGNPVPGEKWDYKLRWLEALFAWVEGEMKSPDMPLVVMGDYNIMPEDIDCHDPKAWRDDALFRNEVRQFFRRYRALGLTDAVRSCTSAKETYTFWDYQAGAWPKNNGLRIDHLMLSPLAADRLHSAGIDKHVRGQDKPSDHVPVWAEFAG